MQHATASETELTHALFSHSALYTRTRTYGVCFKMKVSVRSSRVCGIYIPYYLDLVTV